MEDFIYLEEENAVVTPPRRPLTRREKYLRKKERDRLMLRTAADVVAE
jgi:hypothetical protein